MLISMVYFVLEFLWYLSVKKQKKIQIYEDIIKKFVPVILNSWQFFTLRKLATSEVISDEFNLWKLKNKYLITALVSKVN